MEVTPKSLVIAAIVLGAVGFGAYQWTRDEDPQATTSAGDSARSGKPQPPAGPTGSVRAEGRVATYPGGTVQVGAETGGRIVKLLVQEQQVVKRGELIAEIDASEERASLAEARARIEDIDANLGFLIVEKDRATNLIKSNSIPKQGYDKAIRDLESARARRAEAVATVQRIEAVIAKKRIVAPIDGTITGRYVEAGETVPSGTRIVTVANLDKRRIEAEIDEYDVARIQVGDSVDITAEGFDNEQWKGVVEMIPDVVAPRLLEPNDPGRPLDIRVLLVKVTLPPSAPLKLGQRVEIAVLPNQR